MAVPPVIVREIGCAPPPPVIVVVVFCCCCCFCCFFMFFFWGGGGLLTIVPPETSRCHCFTFGLVNHPLPNHPLPNQQCWQQINSIIPHLSDATHPSDVRLDDVCTVTLYQQAVAIATTTIPLINNEHIYYSDDPLPRIFVLSCGNQSCACKCLLELTVAMVIIWVQTFLNPLQLVWLQSFSKLHQQDES